ncbi:MAG: GNAT family N-acetyltransferase [Kofleriaceae bacterium]
MTSRPLEASDHAAVMALPDAVRARLGAADADAWRERLAVASGTTAHRLGRWRGDALIGIGELIPSARGRTRHVGTVRVAAIEAGDARALWGALRTLADDELGLLRLDAELAEDDAVLPVLAADGFAIEAVHPGYVARADARLAAVALGRLRPGFVPSVGLAPPPPPPRAAAAPVILRRAIPDDAPAVAALMRDPHVTWGTLQLSSTSADAWRPRLASATSWTAEVGGEVVGNAGLQRLPAPSAHVGGIGMAVAGAWQGRGIGGALLDQLIRGAEALGLEALVLDVYDDNARALALYQRAGFARLGTRRAETWRLGGYANSIVMQRPIGPASGR